MPAPDFLSYFHSTNATKRDGSTETNPDHGGTEIAHNLGILCNTNKIIAELSFVSPSTFLRKTFKRQGDLAPQVLAERPWATYEDHHEIPAQWDLLGSTPLPFVSGAIYSS